MVNELVKVNPEEYGLQVDQATPLQKGLEQIVAERDILAKRYAEVIQMEITPENIKVFKELRLKIRDNRTKGLEPWHKAQKAFFLAGGRYVDALKNVNSVENERMEANLEENEKFFEKEEAKRVAALDVERRDMCAKYDATAEGIDLGSMDQDLFEALLIKYQRDYDAAQEAIKQAEKERLLAEAKAKLKEERREELLPLWNHLSEDFKNTFADITDKEFKTAVKTAKSVQLEYELQQEKLRKEKEEAEAKVKELQAKEAKMAARRTSLQGYISFIRDYDHVINLPDKEFDAELKLLNSQWLAQQSFEAAERAKQEELEKSSDKVKIQTWINAMTLYRAPVDNAVTKDIIEKFKGFKAWALEQTNK